MENDENKVLGFLHQAEALRKIARSMLSSDAKSAQTLLEIAERYEAQAAALTPRS